MLDMRHERIVGGRSARFAEVPFVVHLRESQLFRTLGYNKCGGVLINHRWALTAAHCKPAFYSSLEIILGKLRTFEDAAPPAGSAMAAVFKSAGAEKTSQVTGDDEVYPDDKYEKEDEQKVNKRPNNAIEPPSSKALREPNGRRVTGKVIQVLAETVIVHPDYEAKTLENDLALIKLAKPVPFREDIQPICLPAPNEDFTGLDAIATGWGLTHFDKRQLPDTLQVVRLPIISNLRCQAMYDKSGHDKKITQYDLCAGYARGGMDACEGDSGGPLIVKRPNDERWTLAGIVSNGVKCGEPLLPGVYTNVSKFVRWIHEQMRLHA